jgi:hypothetical protein
MPADLMGFRDRSRERRRLRRIKRRHGLSGTAQRARIMSVMAASVVLRRCATRIAMTDFHEAQRIGCGDRSRPGRADRCENLHHQRDQQDREESVQPLPHQAHQSKTLFLKPATAASRARLALWHVTGASGQRRMGSSCLIFFPSEQCSSYLQYYLYASSMTAETFSRGLLGDHFQNCANFEQSLPKRVTSVKRSSTNLAQAHACGKPGGPSLGRSPGAQKAASTRKIRSNLN